MTKSKATNVPKMTQVWIVKHEHRHGTNFYCHATFKGAMARHDLIAEDNAEDIADELDFIQVFKETVDE